MSTNTRLLVLALVITLSATGAAAATADTWTVDTDHDLTRDSAIQRYEDTGKASANLNQFDARLSVASTHDALNVSGVHADTTQTFVQLQYSESIDRTIRIYIPDDYFSPYRDTSVAALEDDSTTASLTPVQSRNYTALEVTVTEPGTYTFAVNDIRGGLSAGREAGRELVRNSTGWTVPSLGGSGQWQYINPSNLTGSNVATINVTSGETAVIQYNAGESDSENWLTVPDCDGSDVAVCYYTQSGDNDTVFVRSGVSDPPEVRYKTNGGGLMESVNAAVRGAQQAVDDILADLDALIGGSNES